MASSGSHRRARRRPVRRSAYLAVAALVGVLAVVLVVTLAIRLSGGDDDPTTTEAANEDGCGAWVRADDAPDLALEPPEKADLAAGLEGVDADARAPVVDRRERLVAAARKLPFGELRSVLFRSMEDPDLNPTLVLGGEVEAFSWSTGGPYGGAAPGVAASVSLPDGSTAGAVRLPGPTAQVLARDGELVVVDHGADRVEVARVAEDGTPQECTRYAAGDAGDRGRSRAAHFTEGQILLSGADLRQDDGAFVLAAAAQQLVAGGDTPAPRVTVTAYGRGDGKRLWSFPDDPETSVASVVGVDARSGITVARRMWQAADGVHAEYVGLDAAGAAQWRHPAGPDAGRAAVWGSHLVVPDPDQHDRLHGIALADGSEDWVATLPHEISRNEAELPNAARSGRRWLLVNAGELVSVQADTGRVRTLPLPMPLVSVAVSRGHVVLDAGYGLLVLAR